MSCLVNGKHCTENHATKVTKKPKTKLLKICNEPDKNDLISSASLKSSYFNFYSRLTLPGDLKPKDIKWLSVWCRQYKVNFGDVFFPDGDIYDSIFDNEVKPEIDWQDPNSSTTLNLSFVAGLLTPILAYLF